MKVGVFDSGIGGLSVARAIEHSMPEVDVQFVHDTPDHFPYATKKPDEIFRFVLPLLQGLVDDHCEVIVIACNTVSTTLITRLRAVLDVPLIAVEPMVKPATSVTKSGVIAVCATPTTLASERYGWLKRTYGAACTFIEPDCADWSYLIEHNEMNEERLRKELEPALAADADVIVLGCTHYHWIEEEVKRIAASKAVVLQPEAAIVTRLRAVLG